MANLGESMQYWYQMHGDRSMPMIKKALGQYDYEEDPAYWRDMDKLRANPTPSTAKAVYSKWGEYMPQENYEDFVKNATNYIKGTPEWYKNEMNRMKHNIAERTKEEEIETTNAKNQLVQEKSDFLTDIYEYKGDVNYGQKQVDAELSGFESQQLKNQYDTEQLKYALDQGLPQFEIDAKIQKLNTQQVQDLYNQLMAENKVEDANQIYDLWKRGKIAETETAEFTSDIRETQVDITEEKHEKIKTSNDYLDEKLAAELEAAELLNIQRDINNKISQLELEKGRALKQHEIDLLAAQVKTQNLRNTGISLDNELLADEVWQSGLQREHLESLGTEELENVLFGTGEETQQTSPVAYWSEALGSKFSYAGTTSDGQGLVYESTQGGKIAVNPETGEQRDYTGKEVANRPTMNPAEILIENPMIGKTFSSEEIATLRAEYDKPMTIADAKEVINRYTRDPDMTQLLVNSALGGNIDAYKKLNYHQENKPPIEEADEYDFSNMTDKELFNYFINSNKNRTPDELATYLERYRDDIESNLGRNIGGIIGQLRMMDRNIPLGSL